MSIATSIAGDRSQFRAAVRSFCAATALLALLAGCAQGNEPGANFSGSSGSATASNASSSTSSSNAAEATTPADANYPASIVVAGGCFWCVESDLEKLPGVGDVVAGYAGGGTSEPTYRNHADHLEVVEAPYDPTVISYAELAAYFLRHIDPLDAGGQFCDRGHSYTTALFYRTPEEEAAAKAAVADAEAELERSIVTPVRSLDRFWIAEGYHQDYYKKNPIRYKFYRNGCGRDDRVAEVWGKASS